MKDYRDLPSFLNTDDGKKVAIRGYIISAQMEARSEEREVFANYLLNSAATKVIEVVGEQHLRDWCKHYLETHK